MARILVIDDNQDLRDLMQVILEQAGYAVELAEDGQAGLAAQRARPADLVITDIFMPNQDGIETVAQFRKEFPELKLIVMSGDGKLVKHSAHFLTAREMGAHGVLSKPFDEDELLRVIKDVLK
jgi:DNA-binding NtrC family response regulator